MTLADYLQQWLADTVKPSRRAGMYLRYETEARKHIVPAIGKVKLARLGPEHVQRLQNECIDKGLGRKSIDLVRATLSGALTQAMRWGLIVRNPVALVEPP
jgi:integrase